MNIFINEKKISVFNGATLKDAVLSYSTQAFKMVKNGYLGIYDRFGFLTEPDGPVTEGQHFYLKVRKKRNEDQNS
jgi:hypothetical protein